MEPLARFIPAIQVCYKSFRRICLVLLLKWGNVEYKLVPAWFTKRGVACFLHSGKKSWMQGRRLSLTSPKEWGCPVVLILAQCRRTSSRWKENPYIRWNDKDLVSGYDQCDISKMDQSLIPYSYHSNRTLKIKGKMTVCVWAVTTDTKRVTVVIIINTSLQILSPVLILESATNG